MVYKGKGLGHGTGHDSDLLPKNEKYSPRGWRWSSYLNWNRPLYLSTLMSDKTTFFQVMLPAACEGRKLLDSMSGCNSFGHWKCTANWALARYLLGNCFAWRQNLRRLQVCLKVAVVTVRMRNAFFVHIFISSSHLFIPLLPLLISWTLISLSLVIRMSCGGGRWEPLTALFIHWYWNVYNEFWEMEMWREMLPDKHEPLFQQHQCYFPQVPKQFLEEYNLG